HGRPLLRLSSRGSMRPVYVAGVGLHPFGRFAEKSLTALGTHAVRAALADAGVGRGGFGAAFCGSVYGGVAAGHKVLTALGLSGVPIVNGEAGCESDVRLEDLARVSAKNHRHGVANPDAMYRRALSVEEILASPVVCEPLRLLMLCAPNEGAAAVVFSAQPTPVRVAAAALRSHHAGSALGEHTPLSGLA